MDFLDFGRSESDFLVIWRLQAVPDTHFEDFGDCFDFGGASGAKVHTHFDSKSQPVTHFLQCCVFDVFLIALFS